MNRTIAGFLFVGTALASLPARAEKGDSYAVEEHVDRDYRKPEWFWFDADAGVQSINLTTFRANEQTLTAGLIPSSALGPSADFGLGFRLVYFTLGARARVGMFQDSSVERTVGDWQVWSIDGELGFRLPFGHFEPHLLFGAGYTTFGSLGDAVSGLSEGIDVDGGNIRGGLGFDYFVNDWMSVGLNGNAEVLFLSRKGVPVRELASPQPVNTLNEAKARVLEGNGSSIGSAFTLAAGAGLHF